jgi:hypothetical protein
MPGFVAGFFFGTFILKKKHEENVPIAVVAKRFISFSDKFFMIWL